MVCFACFSLPFCKGNATKTTTKILRKMAEAGESAAQTHWCILLLLLMVVVVVCFKDYINIYICVYSYICFIFYLYDIYGLYLHKYP
jgi:hypothetical protein